jgi:hypothetical protein
MARGTRQGAPGEGQPADGYAPRGWAEAAAPDGSDAGRRRRFAASTGTDLGA